MSRCNLCGKSEHERNMQDQGWCFGFELCNSCDDLYTEEELTEMTDNGK